METLSKNEIKLIRQALQLAGDRIIDSKRNIISIISSEQEESLIQSANKFYNLQEKLKLNKLKENNDWKETHFNVVEFITINRDNSNIIRNLIETEGTCSLYELSNDLANEFEEKNEGRMWFGEYLDELEEFLSEKLL
jgi:hypothetical protein